MVWKYLRDLAGKSLEEQFGFVRYFVNLRSRLTLWGLLTRGLEVEDVNIDVDLLNNELGRIYGKKDTNEIFPLRFKYGRIRKLQISASWVHGTSAIIASRVDIILGFNPAPRFTYEGRSRRLLFRSVDARRFSANILSVQQFLRQVLQNSWPNNHSTLILKPSRPESQPDSCFQKIMNYWLKYDPQVILRIRDIHIILEEGSSFGRVGLYISCLQLHPTTNKRQKLQTKFQGIKLYYRDVDEVIPLNLEELCIRTAHEKSRLRNTNEAETSQVLLVKHLESMEIILPEETHLILRQPNLDIIINFTSSHKISSVSEVLHHLPNILENLEFKFTADNIHIYTTKSLFPRLNKVLQRFNLACCICRTKNITLTKLLSTWVDFHLPYTLPTRRKRARGLWKLISHTLVLKNNLNVKQFHLDVLKLCKRLWADTLINELMTRTENREVSYIREIVRDLSTKLGLSPSNSDMGINIVLQDETTLTFNTLLLHVDPENIMEWTRQEPVLGRQESRSLRLLLELLTYLPNPDIISQALILALHEIEIPLQCIFDAITKNNLNEPIIYSLNRPGPSVPFIHPVNKNFTPNSIYHLWYHLLYPQQPFMDSENHIFRDSLARHLCNFFEPYDTHYTATQRNIVFNKNVLRYQVTNDILPFLSHKPLQLSLLNSSTIRSYLPPRFDEILFVTHLATRPEFSEEPQFEIIQSSEKSRFHKSADQVQLETDIDSSRPIQSNVTQNDTDYPNLNITLRPANVQNLSLLLNFTVGINCKSDRFLENYHLGSRPQLS